MSQLWGWWWRRTSNGASYERWVARQLRRAGWAVQEVGGPGDQGIDLIATKGGVVVGVQCKWREHGGSVDNGAVQEVYAGGVVVGVKITAVITNGWFTRGARRCADATGVVLMKDDDMKALWMAVRPTRRGWKLRAAIVVVSAGVATAAITARAKIGPDERFHPHPAKEVPIFYGPEPIPHRWSIEMPPGGLVMRCVERAAELIRRRPGSYKSLFTRCMSGRG